MPRSTLSPEARAHANEHQKKCFCTLTTTLPRATADDFRKWCAENSTTVHAELKKFVESKLKR